MEKRILSIQELNRYIRQQFEADPLLPEVWVRGEISNFTHHSSGHMYFTLKDTGSRVRAIMFASHNKRLPFVPREGTRVVAQGSVSVFERDGQYQLYITEMQPDGVGSLYLAYEQLKKKLESEGLFDESGKRKIPTLPSAIGVITSPTGAAVRDILITLGRRFPGIPVMVYPALVQGKEAAASIVRGIRILNRLGEAEVLIIGRGGGSLEELWAFNEEIVARAIYDSAIPVISAVGHETDFTISDFVADLRAATPTAASELAVPDRRELQQRVIQLEQRLRGALLRRSAQERERLMRLQRSAVLTQPQRALQPHAQRLDGLTRRLTSRSEAKLSLSRDKHSRLHSRLARFYPGAQLQSAVRQLAGLDNRLNQAMNMSVKDRRQQLLGNMRQLDALSPLKVMARGYGLVYDEQEKKLIKSAREVNAGDRIIVRINDGSLDCQVIQTTEEGDQSGS
ncbi:exodeoxyribonuclease VII large subunit [Saccharibacillus sp. JS10]|uniref:exodeoxyribonuclease VII large subunit n=1 Tax=Saccharibacillus sp. JS10 TaxID=2950552 RepID=UPI00210E615C|nr:exodeoxyribonuclease VII large subunit [Saccharibacillus sp. JS10]MCQ4085883.1 exodeoxyribonuclease VII large subunit [Saccharibacillus sp. JS10]